MISSLQLAKICGVSQGTVDRALHNRSGISENTRNRILKAAREYGYLPNPSAREIMGSASKAAGAIIPADASIFFMDMVTEIKDALAKRDIRLFIAPVSSTNEFYQSLQEFASRRFRCAIVVPPEENLSLDGRITGHIPVLSLISRASGKNVTFLSPDEKKTGTQAVDFLVGKGHKNIMHLTYSRKAIGIIDRIGGYKRRMRDLGLTSNTRIFTNEKRLLRDLRQVGPSAVFCHNDWLALAVIRTLESNGIIVPDDISVMGIDHSPTFTGLYPGLTTLEYPIKELAEKVSRWSAGQKIKPIRCKMKIIKGKTVI